MSASHDNLTRALYLLIAACIGYLVNFSHRESLFPDVSNLSVDVSRIYTGDYSGNGESEASEASVTTAQPIDSWSFRQTMFCKAGLADTPAHNHGA